MEANWDGVSTFDAEAADLDSLRLGWSCDRFPDHGSAVDLIAIIAFASFLMHLVGSVLTQARGNTYHYSLIHIRSSI